MMTLVGYEFPELENVEYDSNWLNVKISVSVVSLVAACIEAGWYYYCEALTCD